MIGISGVAGKVVPFVSRIHGNPGRDNAADWDDAMANIDVSGVGEYKRRDTSHVDASMRPTKRDYDVYLAILYFARNAGWDEHRILEHGPFRVADPTLTFTLLRANRDLKWMGEQIGWDVSKIDEWIHEQEKDCPSSGTRKSAAMMPRISGRQICWQHNIRRLLVLVCRGWGREIVAASGSVP
ncbi:hypothetical protein [uncultured Cohaesibacter sp.]|uniref:MGH1-like glycoside hydrolase domain-containing protein n=1 Tax=uncultured Cohaesibacter sp. TaxID=1002546 RepID=UPI002930B44B|nr:hypothetical protein [uncultured Cohaesibacter sp.]